MSLDLDVKMNYCVSSFNRQQGKHIMNISKIIEAVNSTNSQGRNLNEVVTVLSGNGQVSPILSGVTGEGDLARKDNPFFNAVQKRQQIKFRISTSADTYGNSVNNGLVRQGDEANFVSGKLPKNREWVKGYEGTLLEGTPKDGEFTQYFRVYVLEVLSTEYVYVGDKLATDAKGNPVNSGDVIEKDQIIGFPKPKPASGQGGLEKQVFPRDYKVANFDSFVLNGKTWK